MINYYVDPGSGFVFVQNTFFFWSIILGFLSAFFIFFRLFFRFLKRFLWFFCILLAIFIIGWMIMHKGMTSKKVIILGIDGMDPKITEQLMQEGRLPNFSYLKEQGSFSYLTTTTPSESVVAWSSFMTGLSPGSHAIFDFVMRDPNNYLPYLSLNEVTNLSGKIKVQNRRKGVPFWGILTKNKIPSYIYFCPNTFPAQPLLGKMLSGMGVPDISGTMGKFSFYTTNILSAEDWDSRGKIIHVDYKNNMIDTYLYGPKVNFNGSVSESKVPLRITLFLNEDKVDIQFQGNHFFLKKNTWSNWRKVYFQVGTIKRVYGIVRFYLNSVKPEFELYTSPINFNPQNPPFPISYPHNYSQKIAKKIGLYYTQGMPIDTWALTENRLNEAAFLGHVDIILEEKTRILNEELSRFKNGLFFFYVEALDSVQHMFWRYLNSSHSLYEANSTYQDTIFKYYEKIDQILGNVLKNIDGDTTLIVLSDHGFSSFRRSVHLNRWLLENGFLFLKEGKEEGGEFFRDVDWYKTKAYALGFGGIYLNRIGRERHGIVGDANASDLKQTIIIALRRFSDPKTGQTVVKNVYTREDIFQGPYMNDAPDLFVGFNLGYRASWQTALGGIPKELIEDNKKKWSGDHLVDSNLVPGIIFINRKVDLNNPNITDIAPTILSLFSINKHRDMHGKILIENK